MNLCLAIDLYYVPAVFGYFVGLLKAFFKNLSGPKIFLSPQKCTWVFQLSLDLKKMILPDKNIISQESLIFKSSLMTACI